MSPLAQLPLNHIVKGQEVGGIVAVMSPLGL